ncbi:MAG: lasso RiPP family leader peptide-containing protein [Polyangiaceae bacterium]|nr:lasso RiPP family leader peptide-containing protein [Polyangiaceae bacterium]
MNTEGNTKTTPQAMTEVAERRTRRLYAPPSLVEYGSVVELTRGFGGSNSDAKTPRA